MTSKEYVIWFKGFIEACESQPTSKQWEVLKNKLAEVDDPVGTPIGPGFGVPNTHPFSTWQEPHRTINCDAPNTNPIIYSTNPVISTTPNGTGTVASIPGVGGSSTVTQWNPNKGNWSYTNI